MAVAINWYGDRTTTTLRANITGLYEINLQDGGYVTWQYKRQETAKWSDVTDDNGELVVTQISPGYTVSDDVVLSYLFPGTSYVLKASVYSDAGELCAEPISDTYSTLYAPIIDSFNVEDAEPNSLSFSWTMSYSQVYYGVTEFEVRARKSGTTRWWTKVSDVLEENAWYDGIVVDDYGEYEFQLVLRTYETEVESEIITVIATESVDTCDICCYMSSQDGASEYISKCTVSIPSWYDFSATKEYNENGENLEVTGIPNTCSVHFEAIPANGCVFTQWVYRIGDTTAEQRTSTDNPLVISNPEGNIYIRAEGEKYSPIKSFSLIEPEIDSKTFQWKVEFKENYDEPISYKIRGYRTLFGWYDIMSGSLPGDGMVDYNTFAVETFGVWEFSFVFTIDGNEYKRTTDSYHVAAYPINTYDFNLASAGSLNVIANWNVDRVYGESTTYTLCLYQSLEDGTSSLVSKTKNICSLENTLTLQIPNYGDYFVLIIYNTDGLNFNNPGTYTSETFTILEIEEGTKPPLWEWASPMTGQLTVGTNKEVHPITATEWNNFTARINQMRAYLGLDNYSFTVVYGASNGYADNPTSFTHAIYSEAVEAIQGMGSGAGGELDYVDTTHLNVTMFTELRDELNAAIANFS